MLCIEVCVLCLCVCKTIDIIYGKTEGVTFANSSYLATNNTLLVASYGAIV